MRDFLVEIHTEELPPKALQRLAKSFLQEIETRLNKAELAFATAKFFATPRRLAVLVTRLRNKQPDTTQERKGPAFAAAFDQQGRPTPACIGFARSCGVEPTDLITLKTSQGEWVGYLQTVIGKSVYELLPPIVQQSLAALPIPKRMRWGAGTVEFIRPVHSVIMLYGREIIPAEILGVQTGRKTRGHRFLSKGWINILLPSAYLKRLESKFVIADFERRKEKIREQAIAIVKKTFGENAEVQIQENLLDEVTGLVEWPVAIAGSFAKDFLAVPQEALISAMQDHQRYFPVVDNQGKLLPHFVTISNIESQHVAHLIEGNERVLQARLADAKFFYETDLKQPFENRIDTLKNIVFQDKLGTLHDKALRLATLTWHIAKLMGANPDKANKAGLLAKVDLTSQLVGEFPELQGTAGFYYAHALANDPQHEIAFAIRDQYCPRFSGDKLPDTKIGYALALADRLDTLVGIFGIHQAPTSDKDPFGLRRAAIGILRILIEKELNLDLRELLPAAAEGYSNVLINNDVVPQVLHFMLERLKPLYQEQNISTDVIAAVTALNVTRPYDIHLRIQAVQAFKALPEALALSIANKRVSNILTKYGETIAAEEIDTTLFETEAEKNLAAVVNAQQDNTINLSQHGNYAEVLSNLASLRQPVDVFFDKVLVMTDDKKRRENRLLLLKNLRELFLNVADIALLQ